MGDNSQDTQADELDVDTPVHPFDDNYEKLFGELNTPSKKSILELSHANVL